MINVVSVGLVLIVFALCEFALFLTRTSAETQSGRGRSYLRFWISILGGAVPIGMLAAEVIPRDGAAVLVALVGFIYFMFIRKT